MSKMLSDAFDALLEVHGSTWAFDGVQFRAVAQSGAYAAYNFADGNPIATQIHRNKRPKKATP